MHKNQPLVSICIPIFNGSQYLNDALESVQLQTYSNCEVIISDDNSKDNSIEIVQVFSQKCKYPVKVLINNP